MRSIELARVFYRVEAETKGLDGQLKGAEKSLSRLGDFIRNNPLAAAGALGVALVGVGVKAVQMADQVDAAFRRLGALVPGLTTNIKRAQQGVAALAEETGRSQDELLATAQAIAAQGVESTEDLLTRLRVVTNLARVTGTETAAIAAGLDQVLDVFGLAAEKADEAGVRLFAIAKGKAPLQDLFAALQGAAPGIREAGLSFDVAAQALANLLAEGKSPKQAAMELKQLAAQGAPGKAALEGIAGAAMSGVAAFDQYNAALTEIADTTPEKLKRLEQSWNNFAIKVGSALAGPLSQMLDLAGAGFDPIRLAMERREQAIDAIIQRQIQRGRDAASGGGLGGGAKPGATALTPEEEAHLKALRAEYARLAASFTESAVDDTLLQLREFQAKLAEELTKYTGAYRDQLAAAGQAVIDALRAKLQLLRAMDGIRTTPTVTGAGGAGSIPLRTDLAASNAEMEKRTRELAEAEEELAAKRREALQDAARQAQAIEQAGRGALQLANAMGILSDQATAAAEAVLQIATSASQLEKLSKLPGGASFGEMLPGILSIAGGLASLIGSLFGESPEDRRRREVQQANTDAILELSHKIGALSGVSGSTVLGVQEATRATLGSSLGLGGVPNLFNLRGELAKLGLSLGDLKEVASSLGVTFANTLPSVAELKQLLDAIATSQLTARTSTFAGQLAQLQDLFEVFDITDPLEQLRKLVEVFNDPKFGSPALRKALAGLDLSTPEGRAAAEKAIQELVKRLGLSPDQGGISLGDLGGMSPEEFRQALLDLEKRLDELGQAGDAQGQLNQFAVQRTITEVQANLLASLLTTDTYWNEQTARNTAAIAAVLGASLPSGSLAPPATLTTAGAGVVNLTVNLTLPGIVDLPTATAIGGGIADGLLAQMNAKLGSDYRARKLLSGNVTLV